LVIDRRHFIYIVENSINDKLYVGQTVNLYKRQWDHFSGNGTSSTVLSNAIRKYGAKSFEFVLLESCNSVDEANNREIYWIENLNTLAPSGYNLKTGGGNGFPCAESRLRMSQSHMGQSRKLSEEHKRKIGLPKIGKPRSVETRKKISKALTGISLSEERKRNMSLASYWRKKTHCIRGHPFNEENTRFRKDGGRDCRTCGRLYYHKKKNRKNSK
jgi:group I intron endonuclease